MVFESKPGSRYDVAAIRFDAVLDRWASTEPVVADARCIAGFLKVHVEIEQVNENLHVPLLPHVAAHHAEAHQRLAILGDERRNDRVKRPLARCVGIWMARSRDRTAPPRFCRQKPSPSPHKPEPKPRKLLWMSETMLWSLSAVVR